MIIPFLLGLATGAAVITPRKWDSNDGDRRLLIYEHRPGEPNVFLWVVLAKDAETTFGRVVAAGATMGGLESAQQAAAEYMAGRPGG